MSTRRLFGLLGALLFACSGPASSVDHDAGAGGGAGGGLGGGAGGGLGGGAGGGSGGGSGGGGDSNVDAGEADSGVVDAGFPDAGRYWANTQYPPWLSLDAGSKATVYGQIWIDGRTDKPGATTGLSAELGVGPYGTDPRASGWSWTPAVYNVEVGNNDEFKAELTAPAPGVYDYAFRYALTGASSWGPGFLYADLSDNGRLGTDDGYQPDNAGKLSSHAAGETLKLATLNLHCLNDDPQARLDAVATRLTALAPDLVALQEVCVGAPVDNAAEYLAQKLRTASGKPYRAVFAQTHLANNVTPEGIGLITALPIVEGQTLDLPTADFPRKALLSLVMTRAGAVAFVATHLSFASTTQAQQARLDAANAIVNLANGWSAKASAVIVGGDFNAIPTDAPIGAMTSGGFTDSWAATNGSAPGYTHTSSNPTRRIDYLFVRGLTVNTAALEFDQPYTQSLYVSDHRGVSATVSLP